MGGEVATDMEDGMKISGAGLGTRMQRRHDSQTYRQIPGPAVQTRLDLTSLLLADRSWGTVQLDVPSLFLRLLWMYEQPCTVDPCAPYRNSLRQCVWDALSRPGGVNED